MKEQGNLSSKDLMWLNKKKKSLETETPVGQVSNGTVTKGEAGVCQLYQVKRKTCYLENFVKVKIQM